MRPDAFLFRTDETLQYREASGLDTRWMTDLDGGEVPQVLDFRDDRLLLWFGAGSLDPWAALLDIDDGSWLWTSPPIAELTNDSETMESLLKRADAALYAAKDAGRNCVRTAEPARQT